MKLFYLVLAAVLALGSIVAVAVYDFSPWWLVPALWLVCPPLLLAVLLDRPDEGEPVIPEDVFENPTPIGDEHRETA